MIKQKLDIEQLKRVAARRTFDQIQPFVDKLQKAFEKGLLSIKEADDVILCLKMPHEWNKLAFFRREKGSRSLVRFFIHQKKLHKFNNVL